MMAIVKILLHKLKRSVNKYAVYMTKKGIVIFC